jgi:uncharacterized peroxidase-related enzyme
MNVDAASWETVTRDVTPAASAPPIARLPVPPPGQENAGVQDLIARHHGDHWIRTLAVNPDTARRFAQYFEHLFRAEGARLPLRERELIAVVVSTENGCGLCEIHHTIALGDALDDHVKARRIALDFRLAPLTEREHALVAFAVKVTNTPKDVGESDLAALRHVGLEDADILEALETSAWFNHTNRIFISLGVIPDAKYFGNRS